MPTAASRRLRGAAAVFTAVALAPAARADEGGLEDLALRALLDPPRAVQGDAPAALALALEAIEADPRSPRVVPLLGEARGLWDEVPGGRARALEVLEAAVGDLERHPNRDDVLAAIARLRRALGDPAGARAADASRGFVRRFLAAGGFGLRPNTALHDVFDPEVAAAERALDPGATFRDLRGELGWRPVAPDDLGVGVALRDVLTDSGAVAYAVTAVELPAAGAAHLVYTGPSAKLWLNRAVVAVIDRERDRPDGELRVPVRLRAGWNRVLVKVAGGRTASFTLRFTEPDGAPLPPTAVDPAAPVEVGAGGLVEALPSFTSAGLAAGETPAERAAYARHLLLTGRGEEGYTVLAGLAAAAPELAEAPWFHVLRGDAAQRADHLPAATKRDEARRAYERAVQLDPARVDARRRLAEFAFQDDRDTDGIVLLEEVLADHPGSFDTRRRLFDALVAQEWLVPAARVLEAMERRAPDLPPTLRARHRLERARGRRRAAHAAAERLYAVDGSELWVVAERADLALAAGDREAARDALDDLVAAGVLDAEAVAARRLRLARAAGDRAAELDALRDAVRAAPWKAGRRLALARRLAEDAPADEAAREEALALLDALLAEEPGRHDARRLRRALAGEAGDFWAEWAPDVAEVLTGSPDASKWPRAQTACLFDQTVTRIYPDGSSVDVVHQLWRILNEAGVERYGTRPRAGELLEVRTITPSGRVLEPIRAGDGFQMPGLEPGAVVEHAFKVERDAPAVQYTNGPWYFMDPELTEPFWFSRWVIWIHEDAAVDVLQYNMARPGITREVERRGPWTIHTFTARDQPRIEPEPLAPEREEFLPWVKVVERRDLEDFASLYREPALRGTAVTPSVAAAAAEVTEGLSSDRARARALYRFVQEHVTGGGRGGSAAEALAAREGSKTTLYLALLAAAGVEADLAWAAPGPDQARVVDWSHPEPGQFQVPLVRVAPATGQPVWVFAEAPRLAPFGRLPRALSGGAVYVCRPGGGLLGVLPADPLASVATETRTAIRLEEGGGARVELTKTLADYDYYGAKENFATAPAQALRGFFAQQANQLYPGARLLEGEGVAVEEPGEPLAFRFVAATDAAVRRRGDGHLELAPPMAPSRLGQTLGSFRRRLFDIVVKDGVVTRDVVEVDLGPYACPRLPASVSLTHRLGQFSLLFARTPAGGVRIERALSIRPGRVTPADYPRFQAFLRKVDEAEQRAVHLEPRS